MILMARIHISEAEAVRDFPDLLARVRAGAEIVIDDVIAPISVHRVAAAPLLRRLSESLRLARQNRCAVTLDNGFSADLEVVINSHPEPVRSTWE